MFIHLYNDIIFRPLLNLLVFFYNIIPDIGVVIVLITILIRLILAPSFHKSLKSQKAMNDLQPKLNEVREKYKSDKEGQAKAMMDLYKEHKINPLSSCLPLVIQLPILIALYQVFRAVLGGSPTGLYTFVHNPGVINPYFLHVINLSKAAYLNGHWYIPGAILAVIAGVTQYWQSKLMMPNGGKGGDSTAKIMAMQTTYILPLLSAFIALRLPAGLPLYWVVTTLFAVGQQYYIIRQQKSGLVPN